MADWDVTIGAAPPETAPEIRPSLAEIQRRSAAANPPDDPVAAALGTAPALPDNSGFLSRSWKTIQGIPEAVAPAVSGVMRGARDVIDPAAELLARAAGAVLPVDASAVAAADKTTRDEWNYEHTGYPSAQIGRVGGQILASALPAARIGGAVSAGASLVPGAVGTAARFLTGAAPAASTIGRAGQLALQGAGQGALQAGMTSGAYDQPVSDQIASGALIGAPLGVAAGGLTKAIDVLRGYSGGVMPEVANLARLAKDQYGIDVRAPSLATNPTLRIIMDQGAKLPFSGAREGQMATQRQVQGAIAGEMGSSADTFGPAVMDATADRLSNGYNTLYANAPPIAGGAPLANDLVNVGVDASRFLVGDPATHVGNAIREVSDAFSGGTLDPQAYKSLMGAKDGTLAKIENAAPSSAAPYLADIRRAVQDRFAASAGPEAADELRNLDSQWRVMKTVDPLAAKSNLGDIQVGGLRQQAINASNRFDGSTSSLAYTGGGAMGDLGRIGHQFFGSLPDSGTAAREAGIQGWKAAVAAVPSLLLNSPLQAALRRPVVARRMIDTSLGGAVPDIGRAIPYSGLLGPIDLDRSSP